jgi:hypothetical protein
VAQAQGWDRSKLIAICNQFNFRSHANAQALYAHVAMSTEQHHSHIKMICGRYTAVPQAGVLDRSALVAEVDVSQSVSLAKTVGPFKIVE